MKECSKVVDLGYASRWCGKLGTVKEDGDLWCAWHAPSAEKARADERAAKRQAEATGRADRILDAETKVVEAAEAWRDYPGQWTQRLYSAACELRDARKAQT